MKPLYAAALVMFALICPGTQAFASPAVEIFYDRQDLGHVSAGVERYQYTYTVVNNSLTHNSANTDYGEIGVTMFDLYFPARQNDYSDLKTTDAALYSNLVETGTPNKWNLLSFYESPPGHPLVDQAVWVLNAYGSPDHGATIYPLRSGNSLSGFSVTIDYSGTGVPGDQQFSILDPYGLSSYFDGRTQPNVAAVPLPPTALLLGTGFLCFS